MAGNRMICHCKEVSYVDIRKAMIDGARTLDDIRKITGANAGCSRCASAIEQILSSACGCKNVPLKDVVNAVKNGANTTDKVAEATGAGTGCGRCKALVENVIKLKR